MLWISIDVLLVLLLLLQGKAWCFYFFFVKWNMKFKRHFGIIIYVEKAY